MSARTASPRRGRSVVGRGSAALVVTVSLLGACGARTGLDIDPASRERPGRAMDGAVADGQVEPGLADGAPSDALPAILCDRTVRVTFTPTDRAQIAVWIRSDESGPFATLAMTEATGRYGIGNRPGALQMNSGYRWPYGRRENVLPAWAATRLEAGEPPFRRVVFRSRIEGHASGSGAPSPDGYEDTEDAYFCLSFLRALSQRDNLDAVSCASTFTGDKGRYISTSDVTSGYAEPEESLTGAGGWRPLSLESAYPPRRDLELAPGHPNHPDAERFRRDAERSMPSLDAVTMATPPGDVPVVITWSVPASWPAGPYSISVELNTEGDYGDVYGPSTYPTPTEPAEGWDSWARTYGYPYRGQPSVIFDVSADLPPRDRRVPEGLVRVAAPVRMGSLDGSLGVSPIDGSIRDDPIAHPGSGADRLRIVDGARVTVAVEQRCRP